MYIYYEKLRKERNLSTADVCKGTGISPQSFTNWKKRGTGTLNAENMARLASYFEVNTDYFVTGVISDNNDELSHDEKILIELYRDDSDFRQLLRLSRYAHYFYKLTNINGEESWNLQTEQAQ